MAQQFMRTQIVLADLGLLCLVFAALCLSTAVQAARLSDTYNGRKVLVTYITGLSKHVAWPNSAFGAKDDPIVICVFGADPFEGGLENKIEGKSVGKRELVVKQLGDDLGAIDAACHQIFIAASEKSRVKEILHRLDNLSVLSLSDMEGFAAAGGMIGFVGSGNMVAMQINRTTLLTSGLEVAPALLRLTR